MHFKVRLNKEVKILQLKYVIIYFGALASGQFLGIEIILRIFFETFIKQFSVNQRNKAKMRLLFQNTDLGNPKNPEFSKHL